MGTHGHELALTKEEVIFWNVTFHQLNGKPQWLLIAHMCAVNISIATGFVGVPDIQGLPNTFQRRTY